MSLFWLEQINSDSKTVPQHDEPTPALSAAHIRGLIGVSTTPRDQLLVMVLAGWGLRASEVAALHISQFNRDVPDDDVPYIAFESRKMDRENYQY